MPEVSHPRVALLTSDRAQQFKLSRIIAFWRFIHLARVIERQISITTTPEMQLFSAEFDYSASFINYKETH